MRETERFHHLTLATKDGKFEKSRNRQIQTGLSGERTKNVRKRWDSPNLLSFNFYHSIDSIRLTFQYRDLCENHLLKQKAFAIFDYIEIHAQ